MKNIPGSLAALLTILISFGCLANPGEINSRMLLETDLEKKPRQSKQAALYPLYNEVKTNQTLGEEKQLRRSQVQQPVLFKSLPSGLIAGPQR